MDIILTLRHLYPTLKDEVDYDVVNLWQWDILNWLNTEIPQPTQAELETAWAELQTIQQEEARQANIRNDIANTLVDFNWGKFKIRKKDFAPIIAQFMDIKEYDVDPVNVLDYYYTPIPFTYQDFLDFKTLVSTTQTAILIENS